jgi:hypothetical protein
MTRDTSHRFSLLLMPLVVMLSPLLAFAHRISEEQKARMLSGGYVQYIVLGAEHMLTGYDHLLFLFGVVFF